MSDWSDIEMEHEELREEANAIARRAGFASASAAWPNAHLSRVFPSHQDRFRLAEIHRVLGGRW